MGSPANAEILVVSATWGAAVGVAVDFSWSFTKSYIAIRGEDSIDPDQQGLIGRNCEAELSFLHGPLTCSDTAASLVIVTRKVDGTTHTDTITNLICVDCSKSMNRDSPPAIYKQRFIGKGTMAQP